jgi:hypothetical protein
MGWGRMLLLGNIGQQMDLDDLNAYLERAVKEIEKNNQVDLQQAAEIARLKRENQELKLYTLGLIRLLAAKGVVTDTEVNQLVASIDRPD